MLHSGKICRHWNNQLVQLREITRLLYQQPQGLIILSVTSTQLNTLQRSQQKTLNDAMWSAIFSALQNVVTIVQGIKGSIIIIIGLRDTNIIMPSWHWWLIPTRTLKGTTMNRCIPAECPCKLTTAILTESRQ